MNKKLFFLALALFAGASLSALPLTIFYTGDTHGVYEASTDRETGLRRGGYLVLEQVLEQQRQMAPRSVYLDSGDQQTGTIFASLVENVELGGAVIVHGGAVIGVFNRLGLDASVFGNHEFDFSYRNTLDLARLAQYPIVSTNLLDRSTRQSVGGTPFSIIERDGLRIGIFGITLELLPEKVKAENVSSVRILPQADAIQMYLDEVDLKTDLIVVLSHQGFEADSLLAESLDDRVDLIIGGHDHIKAEQPILVNGKYLLYSGSHLNYLGKAELEVENDRVISIRNTLLPLVTESPRFQTPLADYIDGKVEQVKLQMQRLLGHITEDWVPDKHQSTALSRWVASSLKAEYQSLYAPDLAIINNGGLRKFIPAGPVTLGDMHELLPFNNTVVVFSCHGRDILILDELNALHAETRPHDICERTELEQPLDPEAVYKVVSHDYIAGQWDKYLGFKPFDVYDTGVPILDAMIRQFELQYGLREAEGWD
ncbi:MAG: bifunctional metallophosphatase/5'-nucleotidase [Candidatus Syntrophosphaera sp.]|nr:bifunctional metallophosphatase/5'-nucleotidase [Candidatus Syntrophosphaera sp.]